MQIITQGCRDKAKPNNYKYHAFENIDYIVVYQCLKREQMNQVFFQFCLEAVNGTYIDHFCAFVD